jgi:hypothetical protein
MNETIPTNRAERRAAHKAQVAETRRRLREDARKMRLAKLHGNTSYRVATA